MCLTPGWECDRSSSMPSKAPRPSFAADGLQTSLAAFGASGAAAVVIPALATWLIAIGVPAAARANEPRTVRRLNCFGAGKSFKAGAPCHEIDSDLYR